MTGNEITQIRITEGRKGVRFAGWEFVARLYAITAYLNSLDMNYTNGSNIYVSSRFRPDGAVTLHICSPLPTDSFFRLSPSPHPSLSFFPPFLFTVYFSLFFDRTLQIAYRPRAGSSSYRDA